MKKVIGITALGIVGLFFLLQSSGEATSAVTVRCSAGQLLQPAIDAAEPYTTITVHGLCNENIVVDETKSNLTIIGATTAVTIQAATTTSGSVVEIKGRGITIQSLNITGGYDGIEVDHGGTAIIDGNSISGNNWDGISVTGSSFATIINNTIQNNVNHGLLVEDNSSAYIGFVCYTDTAAQGNTIILNGVGGITVHRNSNASIVGNSIRRNTGSGICVESAYALISDNVIQNNSDNGISVSNGGNVNLGGVNTMLSGIFNLANATDVNNGGYGGFCSNTGTIVGLWGTLNGNSGTGYTPGGDYPDGTCFISVTDVVGGDPPPPVRALTYPPGSGIPIVSGGTSWGTTLSAVNGDIIYGSAGVWAVGTPANAGIAPLLSPSFTTPALGVATATSVNGVQLASNSAGFSLTGGTKTFTVDNSLTLAGTDATIMTFPSASKTLLANDLSNLTLSGQTQGDIVYFNGSNWVRLGAGTSGYFLETQGSSANPVWTEISGGFTGGTLTSELITEPSETANAPLNIPPGSAPSSPNNGDIWTTSAGVFAQVNGSTVGPFGTGGSGSMTYPPGTGIPMVSGGSAWGTTLSAVNGDIIYGSAGVWTAGTPANAGIAPLVSPSFTTPALGVATAASVNGVQLTSNSAGFSLTGGTKTFTVDNSLTMVGTDATTLTFPSASKTLLANDLSNLTLSGQTEGDIVYFNGSNWVRLGAGTSGYFLETQGTSANPVWASVSAVGGMTNPMTTTGDMIYSSSGSTPARLADVAAGQPLLSGGISAAPDYAGYTFSGTGGATYTFPPASETLASLAGTETFTNKTFDATIAPNELKRVEYMYFTHPDRCDGTGAILDTTSTDTTFGQCYFSASAAYTANTAYYEWVVPPDIDTTGTLTVMWKFSLGGADTNPQCYKISMADVADGNQLAGTYTNVVNLPFAGNASGAGGMIFTIPSTTLTSWNSSVTPGHLLQIMVGRDGGNEGPDCTSGAGSAVASYSGPLTISYKSKSY